MCVCVFSHIVHPLLLPVQELADVSEANRQALLTLDSALFVLCLDDAELTNETDTTHCMLHNYGANRYMYMYMCDSLDC